MPCVRLSRYRGLRPPCRALSVLNLDGGVPDEAVPGPWLSTFAAADPGRDHQVRLDITQRGPGARPSRYPRHCTVPNRGKRWFRALKPQNFGDVPRFDPESFNPGLIWATNEACHGRDGLRQGRDRGVGIARPVESMVGSRDDEQA
jgi:hypothetical protein